MTSIYALVDPRDGRVRYIGASKQPDARLLEHCQNGNGTPPRRRAWVMDLEASRLSPELRILEQVAAMEDPAFAEQWWIARYASLYDDLLNERRAGWQTSGDDVMVRYGRFRAQHPKIGAEQAMRIARGDELPPFGVCRDCWYAAYPVPNTEPTASINAWCIKCRGARGMTYVVTHMREMRTFGE